MAGFFSASFTTSIVMSLPWKREYARRSSMPAISFGYVWLLMMICLFAVISASNA
jgi:hypothetical protein